MELSTYLCSSGASPLEKEPQYPLDMSLGGPQTRYGCGGEEKKSLNPPRIGKPVAKLLY